ncbi:hypothetical protein pb186bvf_011882 [Paramecium bursaria]
MQHFKKLDLFGSVFTLNVNRNDKQYKSVIGGITSFLLYFCSLAYFIYKIQLWSSGQIQPKITSQSTTFTYQEYIFQQPPIEINMNTNMNQLDEDPFDQANNYISFAYKQSDATIESEPQIIIPTKKNVSGSSSFIIPQNISLILNPPGQKGVGQKSEVKGILYVALCDKQLSLYNITCASDEKLYNFVNKFQGIQIWVNVNIFNPETKQTQVVVLKFDMQLDFYAPFLSQLQLKITEQYIDDSIFINTQQTSKYISSCNLFSQPLSQITFQNQLGIHGFGMFMISISPDGDRQKITYPKLGEILADVGSIMSTLLSIGILAQLINSYLLEEQILYQIIASYFPDFKYHLIQKDLFGRIKSVQINNQPQDVEQYQIKLDILKEKARNKINVINQIYELSRLQFIVQGLVDRHTIINSHKLGIKWQQNQEELNSLNMNHLGLQIEDFTILSYEQLDKQDDIKIYDT